MKQCPVCNIEMEANVIKTVCNICGLYYYNGVHKSMLGFSKLIGDYLIEWYDDDSDTCYVYLDDFVPIELPKLPYNITIKELKTYLVFQ